MIAQSQIQARQLDVVEKLMGKHLQSQSFAKLDDDLVRTSSDRGFARWEQQHLVAALDVLNAYEHDRLAQCAACGPGFGIRKQYKDDPRTRVVELLKRWLRCNATTLAMPEAEVRSVCSFCRDLLNHSDVFPARNQRSFLHTIVEVYTHLQRQLHDVLKSDRTCAELIQRVLSLSRNLISDAIGYVLLAPTDLRETDSLPSLEVVSLWQTLPNEGHPLPDRADPKLQGLMQVAWSTQCGSLVSGILRTPWCVRLFEGTGAKEEATALSERAPALVDAAGLPASTPSPNRGADAVLSHFAEVEADFEQGRFKQSGLAGAFRNPSQAAARRALIVAMGAIYDLAYLIGEVVVHFQHVSSGLGDYGTIRVAPWLHPFLDVLAEKVQILRQSLEHLNKAVDEAYVLARARGRSIEKPAPSDLMCKRAHASFERAFSGRESHCGSLLQALTELKARSAPERLPELKGVLGDAYSSLHKVLFSQEFRQHVGDSFPMDLPRIIDDTPRSTCTKPSRLSVPQLTDISTEASSGYDVQVPLADAAPSQAEACWLQFTRTDEPWGIHEAEVYKMTRRPCSSGMMRHDRRTLLLEEDHLVIFEPGSTKVVKTRVYLPKDMSYCEVSSAPEGRIMTVEVLRIPTAAPSGSGVVEHKVYRFEFSTRAAALAFQRDLLRRQSGRYEKDVV